MDDAVDDGNHYTKQRRNFIALSLIVIIYHTGEITLNEINFLGTKIDIANPETVTALLHIFFLYFAWRFWNAFSDINAWKKHVKKPLSEFVHKKTETLALRIMREKIKKHENLDSCFLSVCNWRNHSYVCNIQKISDFKSTTVKYPPVVIKGKVLFKIRFNCTIQELLGKSIFSEYIFPFLLGILAVITIFNPTIIQEVLALFVW